MNVIGILNSPWAIIPANLLQIQAIYRERVAGLAQDIAEIEASLGRPLNNERMPFTVDRGVAVIPLQGVTAKRANLFTQVSGATSTELVASDIRKALADPGVHSILLDIDSPGGAVDGTQALGNVVLAARDVKPVVALASGKMASAAYWIGSAAHAVYVADDTTLVGSIGVVASHVDVSRAEEQAGYKTTEIYAGKYKRIASHYAPLSDDGRQTLQDRVDYLYGIFVGAVARHRGVTEAAVLNEMADGRIFVGQQAIDAGLVDGISTMEDLIDRMALAGSAA